MILNTYYKNVNVKNIRCGEIPQEAALEIINILSPSEAE